MQRCRGQALGGVFLSPEPTEGSRPDGVPPSGQQGPTGEGRMVPSPSRTRGPRGSVRVRPSPLPPGAWALPQAECAVTRPGPPGAASSRASPVLMRVVTAGGGGRSVARVAPRGGSSGGRPGPPLLPVHLLLLCTLRHFCHEPQPSVLGAPAESLGWSWGPQHNTLKEFVSSYRRGVQVSEGETQSLTWQLVASQSRLN